MGKRSGLFPRAAGTPENQIGGKLESTMTLGWGMIGITVAGSSRSGKWETRGDCGGGRMRENSFARELMRLCFGERASNRFVPFSRSDTNDWGVISGEKSKTLESAQISTLGVSANVPFEWGANTITWSKLGVSYSLIVGVLSPGARKVRLYPCSVTRG